MHRIQEYGLIQFHSTVTGANRGIGLGIAECCLVNGAARIYSIDIGEAGDDFQSLSTRFPNQLFAIKADVTQESSISAAVDKIVEEAGALHGMVVNAGRTNHKSALDFTTEEIEALFSVNVGFSLLALGFWCVLADGHSSCSAHSTRPGVPHGHSSSWGSRGRLCLPRPWLLTGPIRFVALNFAFLLSYGEDLG